MSRQINQGKTETASGITPVKKRGWTESQGRSVAEEEYFSAAGRTAEGPKSALSYVMDGVVKVG